jgi:hypothetical protein
MGDSECCYIVGGRRDGRDWLPVSFDYVYEAIKYAEGFIDKEDFEEIWVDSQKTGSRVWWWDECNGRTINTFWREGEIEELIEKVKQQKKEIKQLKLQLEKQTLSNVLDKKIPLGTKSDIGEILNSVGYTE